MIFCLYANFYVVLWKKKGDLLTILSTWEIIHEINFKLWKRFQILSKLISRVKTFLS
jgi:hypothetical protein